jgi:hypothetical protein
MNRLDTADNTDTLPTPTAPGPNPGGYYRLANVGSGIQGSIVPSEHLNAIQEEIANAIEGAGLTLDKADYTQLSQAIGVKNVSFLAMQTGPMQEFNNLVYTRLAFNSTLFNNNNDYNVSTFEFTPKVAGIYLVLCRFASSIPVTPETNSFQIDIFKNESIVSHEVWTNAFATSSVYPSTYALVNMNGTTDKIFAMGNSSFSQIIKLNQQFSFLCATKVN